MKPLTINKPVQVHWLSWVAIGRS